MSCLSDFSKSAPAHLWDPLMQTNSNQFWSDANVSEILQTNWDQIKSMKCYSEVYLYQFKYRFILVCIRFWSILVDFGEFWLILDHCKSSYTCFSPFQSIFRSCTIYMTKNTKIYHIVHLGTLFKNIPYLKSCNPSTYIKSKMWNRIQSDNPTWKCQCVWYLSWHWNVVWPVYNL